MPKGENPNAPTIHKLSPVTNGGQSDLKDEERRAANREALLSVMEYMSTPVVKDEQEASERLSAYFIKCAANGTKPVWEETALVLGTTRQSLWNWETGLKRGPLSVDFVKKIKEMLASYDAKLVAEGKLNPVTYIFRSKNYYGMKDETEMVVTPRTEERKAKELMELAEELPE